MTPESNVPIRSSGFLPALATGIALAMHAHVALAITETKVGGLIVKGPVPGKYPGDRLSPAVEKTYPFYSTNFNLAERGYVEEEFLISGFADAWTGVKLASGVPFATRIVVRRPTDPKKFNGTVLFEWQSNSVGADLDSLFLAEPIVNAGYAWIGVTIRTVGVENLRRWSPIRYGSLDATAGGRYKADELAYDIFAQAGQLVRARNAPLGGLEVKTLLAIGSGEAATHIAEYYNYVLPHQQPVFDGFALVDGGVITRAAKEPVFQIVSETLVREPRPADSSRYRRWEIAGSAPGNWAAREYREPISVRDKGEGPGPHCMRGAYSRVPWQHAVAAAFDHLMRWVRSGMAPPTAEPIKINADGSIARNELGLALGGVRLSQVEAPISVNTGDNSGEGIYCSYLGSYTPLDKATLKKLYPTHADYVAKVEAADARNVKAGYILPEQAKKNAREAAESDIGK
jgi:hypothetical protein